MRRALIEVALLVASAAPAIAQNPPVGPAVERAVLAAGKLPDLGKIPVYFCTMSVSIPAAAASRIAAPSNGILFQLAGSTEVTIGADTKTVVPGAALFIPGGNQVSLKAGTDGPSRILHFWLVPETAPETPAETEPAHVTELFRSPGPIPGLKPGTYEINLSRVTFPPQMPANPPHHRSGAALYYILSGTGANTVNGSTTEKGPGSLIYEPSSLVHQWGNPGSEPWTFLAFNINPEGTPAVVPEAAPK